MAPKPSQRTVLITGCSDGSLGAGLAIAYHNAGLYVYATSRKSETMTGLRKAGIETLELDVCDSASIAVVVAKIPSLDILVNNAGTGYSMPITDIDFKDAKALFDLNVWSYIGVTQAFFPLLRRSERNPMVVNQTSGAGVLGVPFQSVYNASKAAMMLFSETMRMEFASFGIQVIDLRTTMVKSNMLAADKPYKNAKVLPEGSAWEPVKNIVEPTMRGERFMGHGWETQVWADKTVKALLKNNPPFVIYGGEAWMSAKFAPMLPHGSMDGWITKLTGLDKAAEILKKHKTD